MVQRNLALREAHSRYEDFEAFGARHDVFTPDSALELAMVRGFFTPGLQIRHGQSAYPKQIIFWCFNPAVLKAGLERLGWTVS